MDGCVGGEPVGGDEDYFSKSVPKSYSKNARTGGQSGKSNAARISLGSEHDTWFGLTKKDVERDNSQHGTITVTAYYTVAGGIPTEEDIVASIEDLNGLYATCSETRELENAHEITKELSVKDVLDIKKKVVEQGYKPTFAQSKPSTFPMYK